MYHSLTIKIQVHPIATSQIGWYKNAVKVLHVPAMHWCTEMSLPRNRNWHHARNGIGDEDEDLFPLQQAYNWGGGQCKLVWEELSWNWKGWLRAFVCYPPTLSLQVRRLNAADLTHVMNQRSAARPLRRVMPCTGFRLLNVADSHCTRRYWAVADQDFRVGRSWSDGQDGCVTRSWSIRSHLKINELKLRVTRTPAKLFALQRCQLLFFYTHIHLNNF